MKCSLSDIEGLRRKSKISGTSALKSWTKPGVSYSNLIDRAKLRRPADQSARVSATGESKRRPQTFDPPQGDLLATSRTIYRHTDGRRQTAMSFGLVFSIPAVP
jgi:hypothetical protein